MANYNFWHKNVNKTADLTLSQPHAGSLLGTNMVDGQKEKDMSLIKLP